MPFKPMTIQFSFKDKQKQVCDPTASPHPLDGLIVLCFTDVESQWLHSFMLLPSSFEGS